MTGTPADLPIPQGRYVAARRHGDLVFTAGMTPRRAGVLTMTGLIRIDVPLEAYQDAVILACRNAINAARGVLGEGETITGIVSLTVFLAAEKGFSAHSAVADFASNFLWAEFGDTGNSARAAVGVASLPGDAPVEIQIIATVSREF